MNFTRWVPWCDTCIPTRRQRSSRTTASIPTKLCSTIKIQQVSWSAGPSLLSTISSVYTSSVSWILRSGGRPRERCCVNWFQYVCAPAGGRSQSDPDVLDHCDDVQRGVAALSADTHRHGLRSTRARAAHCQRCSKSVLRQLVRQSRHLRAHVETFPPVARSGGNDLPW